MIEPGICIFVIWGKEGKKVMVLLMPREGVFVRYFDDDVDFGTEGVCDIAWSLRDAKIYTLIYGTFSFPSHTS